MYPYSSKTKYSNMPPRKAPPTHFLCLPLITPTSRPQLSSSLSKFKALASKPHPPSVSPHEGEASESEQDEDKDAENPSSSPNQHSTPTTRIPDKAIRPLGTLHLTLGVMSLPTRGKLNEALALLQELDVEALLRDAGSDQTKASEQQQSASDEPNAVSLANGHPDPLTITLRSLLTRPTEPPENCTVLYAAPHDSSSRLLPFCASVIAQFTSSGLMEPDGRPLLLHATVANTVYCRERKPRRELGKGGRANRGSGRGGSGRDAGGRGTGKLKLDVRELMEKMAQGIAKGDGDSGGGVDERRGLHSDWTWAKDFRVERIAICEMGAKRVDDQELGEEYIVVGWKALP
jgi:activating signal cointegrator complex subunit 1